jgi:hypothetical protein
MLNLLIGSGLISENRLKKFACWRYQSQLLLLACISGLSLLTINCGGGGSSSSTPITPTQSPAISALTPSSATIGSSAFTLTLTGSYFTSSCPASWGGTAKSTTYVNSSTLTIPVLPTDIANTGTIAISASCGGKTSNSSNFFINNPAPALSSITPVSTIAGSNTFTLTLNGSNFLRSSSVRWNGNVRTSTFVSSTALTITINPTDVATAGLATLAVINPTPGGGEANYNFTIQTRQPLVLQTKSLPDAAHNKEYNYILQADGGIPPYIWTTTSGSLPSGLSIVSGKISGTPPSVTSNTTYNFSLRLTDSGYQPASTTQNLSIRVLSGSLGRNETCATASSISNGITRASISPVGDIDVYTFQGTQNAHVTIQVLAQRLSTDYANKLDSFLELLNSNCVRLTYNDDGAQTDSWDSTISDYTLPSTGAYYIRVSSIRGDARPDLVYNLSVSGAD